MKISVAIWSVCSLLIFKGLHGCGIWYNKPCPPVDGGFSPFDSFSPCSATCGAGTQKRSRTCTNPAPKNGGKSCVGDYSQTQTCNLGDCKIDGGYSEWSSYSACSASCGDGFQQQSRSCNNPAPIGGGKECVGPSLQSQKCNLGVCIGSGLGFDLQWSLLKKEACFQAKDDMPAHVPINQNGMLAGIKLVYVNGLIKCHSSFTGSNFGCSTDQTYFNLAVTDKNKLVLFPSLNQGTLGFYLDGSKNYRYPGYLPTDKEVTFVNYDYPTYLKTGDYISIWNYEDLLDHYEGDNSGRVCVDVYGAFV